MKRWSGANHRVRRLHLREGGCVFFFSPDVVHHGACHNGMMGCITPRYYWSALCRRGRSFMNMLSPRVGVTRHNLVGPMGEAARLTYEFHIYNQWPTSSSPLSRMFHRFFLHHGEQGRSRRAINKVTVVRVSWTSLRSPGIHRITMARLTSQDQSDCGVFNHRLDQSSRAPTSKNKEGKNVKTSLA